ncbi:hypothetical protein [Streptomyces sp. NPDC057554]|uniref:hypothetical protein n=1 Tax=Streptomyces sp. NPDC057554 TaxID=3350538 RepID=UPI0036991134
MRPRRASLRAAAATAVIGAFLASGCAPAQEPKAAAGKAAGAASAGPPAEAPAMPLMTADLKGLAFKDGEAPQATEGSSTLASYQDGRAEQRFAELERALAACHSFEGEGYVGPYKATVKAENSGVR